MPTIPTSTPLQISDKRKVDGLSPGDADGDPTADINVLLVVYAFPPAGGVGTLRAASLARYLPGEAIRLDVLTTRNPSSVVSDFSLLDEIPETVTIHRTYTLDLPFPLKKRLKALIGMSNSHSTQSGTATSQTRVFKRLLQDILLPDPQVTWLPILTRAARRVIRDRQIDLVLITGAPFSNYLLARRLRKEYPRLPIVLDFRDEWISTCFGNASFSFSRSERARRFAVRAEAAAIASASAVVSVSNNGLREIKARYPNDPDNKYHYIPNGFDASRITIGRGNRKLQHHNKIVVTYVGTLYNSTEPSYLVDALRSLPLGSKNRILLRFVGHIEELRYKQLLLELGEMVELANHVPQREALNALSETDYLLLVSHDRVNVSAKFYDYLGSEKPILACIHPDGEIRSLLEALQAGWWAPSNDVAAIRQLFLNALAHGKYPFPAFNPDTAKIAQYERKALAKRYATLLHSIAENARDLMSEPQKTPSKT